MTLSVEYRDGIGVVTLARPRVLNALDTSLVRALLEAARRLGEDPEVRAVVLVGAGRAFSSGGDVREMARMSEGEFRSFVEDIQDVTRAIRQSPFPYVAAVGGPAIGGGSELACACDLRVASDDAVFGFPEATIGFTPTSGATFLLPAIVGPGQARRLMLGAEVIAADEAHRIGLVDELVPSGNHLESALQFARRVAANDAYAVAVTRRRLSAAADSGLEAALVEEVEAAVAGFRSETTRRRLAELLP